MCPDSHLYFSSSVSTVTRLMYVSEKHESFAREHIAMVRNRIYHKIVEYADIDLDTDQRIRLFDIRVKLNDAPSNKKSKSYLRLPR